MDEINLLNAGPLLNEEGQLNEIGYAFSLLKNYDRKMIKKHRQRIKEWDSYIIIDKDYAVILKVGDYSYFGLILAAVIDFKNRKRQTRMYTSIFTYGDFHMPSNTNEGDVFVENKKYSMFFQNKNGKRRLVCRVNKLKDKKDFSCDIVLKPTTPHSIVVADVLKDKNYFIYSQKVNLLSVKGYFKFGDVTHQFTSNAFATFEFGRGFLDYVDSFTSSDFNTRIDNHLLSLHLFNGRYPNVNENVLYIDSEIYSMGEISFIPTLNDKGKIDYDSNWKILDKEGHIDLIFKPIKNRFTKLICPFMSFDENQIFGIFTGTIINKNKEYKIEEVIGVLENTKNRY